MKKKVRLSRPGYKKGGAPHIAEQNETINSISSGKKNIFLDKISNAAQEQMMNQAMMEAEQNFMPPGVYNYGGVPIYNVGGNFGFAMNPQAMANQSMYANALTDANANMNNTSWLGDFANVNLGKSDQMNIDPTTKEAKSWYKDYSKNYRKEEKKINKAANKAARNAYYNNAYGGTPNYYNDGGAYDYYNVGGSYEHGGPHGTQDFDDYEKIGNSSYINNAFLPMGLSQMYDALGFDRSMDRRARDIANTPGSNVAANIGGNGSTEGMTMWEADKLERQQKQQQANLDLERKRDLFNARRQQANQVSTQDILNNTQSIVEGVNPYNPYTTAQVAAQNIANNMAAMQDRSTARSTALDAAMEAATTTVDDALKGKKKKTTTASTDTEGGADETTDETTEERDLTGSIGADDVNGTTNTGTNTQGMQGNWIKGKGYNDGPLYMPVFTNNGGLKPGYDYSETSGGFMTPWKKTKRWSWNPQGVQNEPVSEAGARTPDWKGVSNNQNQDTDYFGEKRTLRERAQNMRNRFRRNEKLEGFAGDSETDVMLPGGMGASSEQGNMQFTNREPSAQYKNPVPDYNTGYNQQQDDPNYIPEGGVSGPNNEYGEGWTQAEIDEQKKALENQRYGGVPNYFNGGVAHDPPPGFLEKMAYGFKSAIPQSPDFLEKVAYGMKSAIPQSMNQNRGFEEFNMLYDDPTSKATKPFTNNTWIANKGLSQDAKAIAAAARAKDLFDRQQIVNQQKTEEALNNAYSLRKQYGGVVQELTQSEIDQILAMGGKVEYLD